MMTPIAGDDKQHLQSLLARQDYIPAAGLDLTERQRETGNEDHKTNFQLPRSPAEKLVSQEVQPPALADPGFLCASQAGLAAGLFSASPLTSSYIFPESFQLS